MKNSSRLWIYIYVQAIRKLSLQKVAIFAFQTEFSVSALPNSFGESPIMALWLLFSMLALQVLSSYAFTQVLNTSVIDSTRMHLQTKCPTTCRFKLCGEALYSSLGAPNTGVGPTICRKGQTIGFILKTGEAQMLQGLARVPLSEWRPVGLQIPFQKNFFYTKRIPGNDKSGFTFRTPRQNQHKFLNDVCVILPIKEYQRFVNGKFRKVRTQGWQECLAVVIEVPAVVIEFQWFSGDDMDLSVREPKGYRLSNDIKRRTSGCGKFVRDNGADACGLFSAVKERVQYRLPCERFQRGRYTAIINHASTCGNSSTTYELRVVVNGRLKKNVTGVSNKDKGAWVRSIPFSLP